MLRQTFRISYQTRQGRSGTMMFTLNAEKHLSSAKVREEFLKTYEIAGRVESVTLIELEPKSPIKDEDKTP